MLPNVGPWCTRRVVPHSDTPAACVASASCVFRTCSSTADAAWSVNLGARVLSMDWAPYFTGTVSSISVSVLLGGSTLRPTWVCNDFLVGWSGFSWGVHIRLRGSQIGFSVPLMRFSLMGLGRLAGLRSVGSVRSASGLQGGWVACVARASSIGRLGWWERKKKPPLGPRSRFYYARVEAGRPAACGRAAMADMPLFTPFCAVPL